jgi:hypothetical protein
MSYLGGGRGRTARTSSGVRQRPLGRSICTPRTIQRAISASHSQVRLQMCRLRCARMPLVLIQTTRALLPPG